VAKTIFLALAGNLTPTIHPRSLNMLTAVTSLCPTQMSAICLVLKKVITVTGRGGLQECEMLGIQLCLDSRLTAGG
jgi:hypothetical protein